MTAKAPALSTKPSARRNNSEKEQALAAVTKGPLSRLNANVDAAKYKKLQVMALQNGTDITRLVNGWIDTYLEGKGSSI